MIQRMRSVTEDTSLRSRDPALSPSTVTDQGRRRLGVPSLGAIVVANMIGAGVFTTSGFALADLGSRGWVMVAWVLGGAVALLGTLCYGALAARL